MRVLFLAPYLPFPARSGGQLRIYHLLRLAAERHDVHLLTFAPHGTETREIDDRLAHLERICPVEIVPAPVHTYARRLRGLLLSTTPDMILRGQDERYATTLRALLARKQFDVVQAESVEMAQYGANFAPAFRQRPLFCYDAFNAEYLLQRRAFLTDLRHIRKLPAAAYSFAQWQKLRRFERGLRRRFDLILAVSEADRATLAHLSGTNSIAVVPNGVDTDAFRPRSTSSEPPAHRRPYLLFTGTLDFRPNIDAVGWFVRAIWPALHARRPELTLCVVGQRPAAAVTELATEPNVRVVGPVEDVRPWFAGAAAYVLPMRVGGGARLKLLETLAMGVPCVTTSRGAEGVAGLEPGRHVLVEDEPAAFGAAIERLLDDDQLRRRLAAAGRALVVEHYDWRAVATHMEAAWQMLLPAATAS